MNANPVISVIVPVYNVEKYIEKCVDSIIIQTYKNLEIILVDDGSPDKCPEICDNYAKKDSRIKVIHKVNGGLSDARNAGLDIASGKYVTFIDSDDYISFDYIEKLYCALVDNGADMSLCSFIFVDDNYNIITERQNDSPIEDECISGLDIIKKLNQSHGGYYVVSVCKLYSIHLFDNLRFRQGKIHEDEFIIHHVLYKCKRVATIAQPLYFYFQRSGSIMNEKIAYKEFDVCEAFLDRAEFLEDKIEFYECANWYLKACGVYSFYSSKIDKTDKNQMIRLNEIKKEIKKNVRFIKGLTIRGKLSSILILFSTRLYRLLHKIR